jgi:Cu2+-exporting ATPase
MKQDASRCFHCGEPTGPAAVEAGIDGEPRSFCCTGCRAASAWIAEAGLGDYFRLRSAEAPRADAVPEDAELWDREDLLDGQLHCDGEACEITLAVTGMRCAACAWLIDRALRREPGVADARVNAASSRLWLRWSPGRQPLSRILLAVTRLGYRASLPGSAAADRERQRARRDALLRLGVAGLAALQAMMLSEALYLDAGSMPLPTRDFFRWINLAVASPVVFYSGMPFLRGAWHELRGRRIGSDALIAGSVLLAYFASAWQTLMGGAQVWFDAAVMFVFFLLLSRTLDLFARERASGALDALARARPPAARRIAADGSVERVPSAKLAVGDRLLIASGEAVAADGRLLSPAAAFDESLLTGEATPVEKRAGDAVWSGSLCLGEPAQAEVTGSGESTRLALLARLTEQAQRQRPRWSRLAERAAPAFAFALALLATATWWYWQAVEPGRAFEITLAVLVVSCPCALTLAAPATISAAADRLAGWGLLPLRPDVLERLAQVDTVCFDKTGTLTVGHGMPAVQAFGGIDAAQARALAAALEAHSLHPLGAALRAPTQLAAEDVREQPGRGVEAVVDGRRLRIGRGDWAAGGDDDGAVWLGDGVQALARFELGEALREDAVATVRQLRNEGLDVELHSGDEADRVAAIAARLGIDRWSARCLPEDKLRLLRARQGDGACVLMVGDGINDAPVLAGADVSIALGGGAALAQRRADLVLGGERLGRVADAIALARSLRRIIRQNLAWALAYNALMLPAAMAGWLPPWLAALGMAASSLTVVLNSLRLARHPGCREATESPA